MSVFTGWAPWQIALAIVVLIAAIAIIFAILRAVVIRVINLLRDVQIWLARLKYCIKARLRSLKALFVRFRGMLLPYAHSVFKTLIYIVCILVASLAAPQLTKLIGGVFSLILPKECEVLGNCLTISVVAGASTGILFIFIREKPLSLASRILARLSGRTTPAGGEEPEHVRFVPLGEALRLGEDKREYLDVENARKKVNEWMIILRQIDGPRHKYTVECIEEQLKRVQTLLEDEKKKRKTNCQKEMLEAKWVCFVSRDGAFQAFQPYKTFCFHILVKHNARYAAILNTTTEQDFAKAIQTEIDLSQKFKITDATGVEREALVPDAIPDLDKTWVRKGLANDEVLEILIKENKGKAMLVSRCGGFEPIGVLTATELAKLVLYEPLNDTGLYHPHMVCADKNPLYGDGPP